MKIRNIYKTNLGMCNFCVSRVPRYVFDDDRTTYEVLKKATKHLLHFLVPNQTP